MLQRKNKIKRRLHSKKIRAKKSGDGSVIEPQILVFSVLLAVNLSSIKNQGQFLIRKTSITEPSPDFHPDFHVKNGDGNVLTQSSNPGHIAILNSIRYRGYYYDADLDLYYLQSRYYDAKTGRFINADGYITTGQGVLSYNMFAYCGNNPVNIKDSTGNSWEDVKEYLTSAWNKIKSFAENLFGSGHTTTVTISKVETPIIPDPSPITVITGSKTTKTITNQGDTSRPFSLYTNKDIEQPIMSSAAGMNINIDKFTLNVNLGLDDAGIYGLYVNGDITESFGIKLNVSELKIGFERSTAIQWDDITETTFINSSYNGWAILAAYAYATTGQPVPSPSAQYV